MLFNLYSFFLERFVFDLEIITPKNQCAGLLSGSGKSLTHCLLYNLGQQKLGCRFFPSNGLHWLQYDDFMF